MSQDRLERRNYRKVYHRLWKNPDFRSLADPLKVMTLYVLTGPQSNRVGLFQFSFAQAAECVGTSQQQVKNRVLVVCRTFGWEFDAKVSVIWIPSWWAFNPVSENPKNLKGYLTDLNDVPRTALVTKFCANLSEIPQALHPLFSPWAAALTPTGHRSIGEASLIDHRSDTDRTTETVTKTETETSTETETETIRPRQERATEPTPTRQAFDWYFKRFEERYLAKPALDRQKDGNRMKQLLLAHGLPEVCARVDAYFDPQADRFFAECSHTLDVFFAAGTQTKLIAFKARQAPVVKRPAGCKHPTACKDAAEHARREITERQRAAS